MLPDQRLKVRFSEPIVAVFAWNTLNSWMVIGATMTVPLLCGGGALYAGLAAGVVMGIIYLGFAELASAFPSAGGQFRIVYEVFPESCRGAASFLTGYMTICYLIAAIGSSGFFVANMILQLVSLWQPQYTPSIYHALLMHLALCSFAFILTARFPAAIVKMGLFTFGLSLSCFLASIIVVFAMNKNDASGRATFDNSSGWPDGWAMIIAITSSLAAFSGMDAPAHLSEEVRDPRHDVPGVMGMAGMGTAISAITWAMSLDRVIQDVKAVIGADVPILEVYRQVSEPGSDSKALVTVFGVLYVIVFYNMILNLFISSGRVLWSFSKWGGFSSPFCSSLDWGSPLRASGVMLALQIPAAALFLFPSITHSSLANLAVFYLDITLALPQAALLFCGRGRLRRGRFSLGRLGYAVNAASTLLVAFFSVTLFFPSTFPVSAGSMNYLVIDAGISCIFIPVFWHSGIKTTFKKPTARAQGHALEMV